MLTSAIKGVFGFAVIVALVAYIARPRFPDSASNHGLKTALGLSMKLTNLISHTGGMMGFSSINITRVLSNTLARSNEPNDKIKIFTTTMDGVEVLVFQPVDKSDTLRPGIVYYHGGGWVLLNPEQYSMYCQEIALQTGSVVVSVDYRMAPEYLYPIPLEDCLTATRYFMNNAEQYGVDKNKIGVKGDSAGGNLAMAVSLKLSKENNIPKLKFMSLDYPALQLFDFHLPCYKSYEDGPGFLTKKIMVRYWLLYAFGDMTYFDTLYNNKHLTKEVLASEHADHVNAKLLPENMQGDVSYRTAYNNDASVPKELYDKITDPLFAPLMASDEDLNLLPKAYVFNVEFDVLRDDGFILVNRMKKLGIDVTHSYMSTEEHGFLNFLAFDKTITEEVGRFAAFHKEAVDGK
ncbi:Importin subunit alpha-3 [Mactra antiquata]